MTLSPAGCKPADAQPESPFSDTGVRIRVVTHARDQNTDSMNFTKNIGMLLLAIYLILVGLTQIFGFAFGILIGAVALAAGIFILIGR